MALELIHTSAPAGLLPGTSGFCTVAMTTGLPASLEERLGPLGGYRALPSGEESPPSLSHLRLDLGGRTWHVLSAVRAAPPDHSGRANKLAHHLALAPSDLVDAGPAWLMRQPGVLIDSFDGPARWLPQPRALPESERVGPRRCTTWARASGDAGWAGALANHFLLDPSRISCIIYDRECDALQLIDEAISLLPPEQRWRVTFATHFQQPIAGVPCVWRFCLAGTPAALEASRRATGLFVDLAIARASATEAKSSRYVELARDGAAPWWTRTEPANASASESERAAHTWRAPQDGGTGRGGDVSDVSDDRDGNVSSDALSPAGPPHADHARTKRRGDAAGVHTATERRAGWNDSPGRLTTLLVVALVLIAFVAVFAVAGDRRGWWGSRADGIGATNEPDGALTVLERDRLRSELTELSQRLRESEESAAGARQRESELIRSREALELRAESAEARARSAEALLAPPSREEQPRERPRTNASSSTTGAAVDAAPSGAQDPPKSSPPSRASDSHFPASRFGRHVSHLGVVSSDRQLLASLPSPVRAIRVDLPPSGHTVSVTPSESGRQVSVAAAPAGESIRSLARIESEGPDLYFRWDVTGPPQRVERHVQEIDAVLPMCTIIVTLDDGRELKLWSEPAERAIEVGRRVAVVTPLGVQMPTLRLVCAVPEGWTRSEHSADLMLILTHAAGSLRLDLDPGRGTLTSRFTSPLIDELAAVEEELRQLEADRSNILPDEREFHDSAMRSAKERIASLRARVSREVPAIPATLPVVDVDDAALGRTVLKLRLTIPANEGTGGRASGGGAP